MSSNIYAAQLCEHKGAKSSVKDVSPVLLFNYKIYALFTYDAGTLLNLEDSNFSCYPNGLVEPSLLNENFASIEVSKLNSIAKKQENIQNNKSGINALDVNDFITFYAFVKEQSPANSVYVEVVEKLEQGNIYASKYYPQRIKDTVQGRILHLEARIELPELVEHQHELVQLIIFVESSPITIDQNTWASELKQTTINGAGIGINWNYIDNFAFQAYFANELEGQILAISPTLSNLYWIQAVKYY